MSGFRQTNGQIGPIATMPGSFQPTANPWVNRRVQVVTNGNVRKPVAATATIAGRAGIGCCSDCSKAFRSGQ